MKNNSSNDNMEQIFQKLASIKEVEPGEGLFSSILKQIEGREKVSITWLRAAAAIFLILVCTEIILIKKESTYASLSELNSLIPQNNKFLYNE